MSPNILLELEHLPHILRLMLLTLSYKANNKLINATYLK